MSVTAAPHDLRSHACAAHLYYTALANVPEFVQIYVKSLKNNFLLVRCISSECMHAEQSTSPWSVK